MPELITGLYFLFFMPEKTFICQNECYLPLIYELRSQLKDKKGTFACLKGANIGNGVIITLIFVRFIVHMYGFPYMCTGNEGN
jgi:hypothetical protein